MNASAYDTLNETEWAQVDRVHALLDEGEVEQARLAADSLLRRRPGHPDVRVVDATIALEEDEPERALDALKGAERSADPALFFYLRAAALFDLVRLEEASADAERALAIHADDPASHDLLSRLCEHLGRWEEAAEHAEAAAELEPDTFALPLEVSDADFDALVQKSMAELPAPIRKKLEELPIVVEALPTRELLTAEHPPLPPDLLGLFVGPHLLERSHSETPGAPGAIYLFRRNLLRSCADLEELAREVRITVQHEVGHLLGLDEDDLERWGLA